MKNITIKKQQLMSSIYNNCQRHKLQYQEAVEEYKSAIIKYYKELAEKMAKDPWCRVEYNPPERPRSYVKNYEEVYDMLSYEVNEIVTITADEFRSYVQDEWSWKSSFDQIVSWNRGFIS